MIFRNQFDLWFFLPLLFDCECHLRNDANLSKVTCFLYNWIVCVSYNLIWRVNIVTFLPKKNCTNLRNVIFLFFFVIIIFLSIRIKKYHKTYNTHISCSINWTIPLSWCNNHIYSWILISKSHIMECGWWFRLISMSHIFYFFNLLEKNNNTQLHVIWKLVGTIIASNHLIIIYRLLGCYSGYLTMST